MDRFDHISVARQQLDTRGRCDDQQRDALGEMEFPAFVLGGHSGGDPPFRWNTHHGCLPAGAHSGRSAAIGFNESLSAEYHQRFADGVDPEAVVVREASFCGEGNAGAKVTGEDGVAEYVR